MDFNKLNNNIDNKLQKTSTMIEGFNNFIFLLKIIFVCIMLIVGYMIYSSVMQKLNYIPVIGQEIKTQINDVKDKTVDFKNQTLEKVDETKNKIKETSGEALNKINDKKEEAKTKFNDFKNKFKVDNKE